jgi:hypothetical protein
MPLYFHLQNGTEMIRDEEGIEVSDLDAARAEALDSPGTCETRKTRICTTGLAGSSPFSMRLAPYFFPST